MVDITNFTALEAGRRIPLSPGDVLVVEYSFDYISVKAVDIQLWVSLGIGLGRDIEGFSTLHLDIALTTKIFNGAFELSIPTSGKTNGTYWMKIEVNGTEITIPDAVVISGMAGGIWDMIGPLLTLGVMMMMMEMTRGISEPEAPKPITEAVVKGVRGVGKGVKKVTEYFGEREIEGTQE